MTGVDVAAVNEDPGGRGRGRSFARWIRPLPNKEHTVLTAKGRLMAKGFVPGITGHAGEFGAVRVLISDFEVARVIIAQRSRFDRVPHGVNRNLPLPVHTKGPFSDVVVLGTPVRHLAARVILPPTELIVDALLTTRGLRHLTDPEAVIQL